MAQTLGVATLTYAPFAFFNWINPMVAIVYGFMNFTIERLPASEVEAEDRIA
jgi:NhaC family Na+:H+ antiporter